MAIVTKKSFNQILYNLIFFSRNNARVVFAGSIDLFSDKFFTSAVLGGGKKSAKSGNEALANSLSSWCFKLSGVLRVTKVNHHLGMF